MARRKGISQSVRFGVFHRDGFTCLYCGRKPPQVVLELDHIVAVANGGHDEPDNLITSCFDCNHGKAARDLSQAPQSLHERMEERQEQVAQMEAYNQFLLDLRRREQDVIDRLGCYWCNKTAAPKDVDRYTVNDAWSGSLRTFLRHLTEAEIIDAMDLAHARKPARSDYSLPTWRYFCGICWRKIKGD